MNAYRLEKYTYEMKTMQKTISQRTSIGTWGLSSSSSQDICFKSLFSLNQVVQMKGAKDAMEKKLLVLKSSEN